MEPCPCLEHLSLSRHKRGGSSRQWCSRDEAEHVFASTACGQTVARNLKCPTSAVPTPRTAFIVPGHEHCRQPVWADPKYPIPLLLCAFPSVLSPPLQPLPCTIPFQTDDSLTWCLLQSLNCSMMPERKVLKTHLDLMVMIPHLLH